MREPARQLVRVSEPAVLDSIYRLRLVAWRARGQLPALVDSRAESWIDDHEAHAEHWAILQGKDVLGAARICAHSAVASLPDPQFYAVRDLVVAGPIVSLNRLFVVPWEAGKGLSRALDRICLISSKRSQCASVIENAHEARRIKWLMKLGFEAIGPANISQSPHLVGMTTLSLTLSDFTVAGLLKDAAPMVQEAALSRSGGMEVLR